MTMNPTEAIAILREHWPTGMWGLRPEDQETLAQIDTPLNVICSWIGTACLWWRMEAASKEPLRLRGSAQIEMWMNQKALYAHAAALESAWRELQVSSP